jgi:hypothetical protein
MYRGHIVKQITYLRNESKFIGEMHEWQACDESRKKGHGLIDGNLLTSNMKLGHIVQMLKLSFIKNELASMCGK